MNKTGKRKCSTNHEHVMARLPQDRQERIRARAGDLLAQESATTKLSPVELVAHAIDEYRQGRTTNIYEVAKELGIDLTDK